MPDEKDQQNTRSIGDGGAAQVNIVPELFDQVAYTYVNSSQTQGSNWDVRIVFSERFGTKLEPRIGIVMSHQHAKAFCDALTNTIAKLEKLMGEPIRFVPVVSKQEEE